MCATKCQLRPRQSVVYQGFSSLKLHVRVAWEQLTKTVPKLYPQKFNCNGSGVEPRHQYFLNAPGQFYIATRIENHWIGVFSNCDLGISFNRITNVDCKMRILGQGPTLCLLGQNF